MDWYWLVAKMAQAPTLKELRSMSDVVKKANLVCTQHGTRACRWSSVVKREAKVVFLAGVKTELDSMGPGEERQRRW